MKRGRVDSDTFILQSDARINDLDRELDILRQKRQIIQEQMIQKPFRAPFMPERPRQQWNQPYQESQHMVQYPILSQYKPLMNPQQMNQHLGQHVTAPHFTQTSQFNHNPPRRALNQPRRPPMQMGRQNSPPRRQNNPPRRVNNPPPPRPNNPSMRPPRPTYPTSRPIYPPRRPTNPPQRPANPPQRPANPPMDTNKAKQPRKRLRKPIEGQVSSFKTERVYNLYKPGLMFRENEEPSKQVMGRLELALGTLLKSIRLEYGRPPHNVIFNSDGMKYLKAEIRKRVRVALDGKYLGTIHDTMDEYRKVFPLNTDKEMLDAMKEYQESQPFNPDKQTAAEDAFRKHIKENFKSTIDEFVAEMMTKIKNVCAQEEVRVRSELELVEPARETEGEDDAIAASGPSLSSIIQSAALADDAQWHTDVDINQPQVDVAVERPIKMLDSCHPFAKMVYYLISRKLPDVLSRHKEIITSFIDEEKLFNKLYERKRKQVLVERKERLSSPLYLKVLGQPTLPSKKETVLFLKRFNIVSLKRHTKLTNMLVTAVITQQDYEALMAANGITLGNSTLYIQRSKSRKDDSCDFGDYVPKKGDDTPSNGETLKALEHIDEQDENLMNIESDDENHDTDECTNAKKFKKNDGEAIDSTEVFGTNKDDSDNAPIINETETADSPNVDGEVDGLPTGFEVIDSIHDNSDETLPENDSQVTVDNPTYSDATTMEIGEELKDADEVDVLIENNIEVSHNSQSDVEIVEAVQDVITIDDEVEESVSSEAQDVKPLVVATIIAKPRRSSRNVTTN